MSMWKTMSLLKIWLSVYLFDIYDIVSALPYNFMRILIVTGILLYMIGKGQHLKEKLQYKECVVHGTSWIIRNCSID